jgi:ankyrin repeat protein
MSKRKQEKINEKIKKKQKSLIITNEGFLIACDQGNLDIVKHCLVDPDIDLKYTVHGLSALHFAARRGRLDVVRELITSNFDVDDKDVHGRAAIHHACNEGHFDMVVELIKAKANVCQWDNNGWTPFYYACNIKHYDIARELINANVDINTSIDGCTPLSLAVRNNAPDFIKLLIKNNVDVDYIDEGGLNALHCACLWGRPKCARHLIKANIDTEKKDDEGRTPLNLACSQRSKGCVLELLEAGVNLDTMDDDKWTPFHYLSRNDEDLDEDVEDLSSDILDVFIVHMPYKLLKKELLEDCSEWARETWEDEMNIRKEIYRETTNNLFLGHRESMSMVSLLPRDMIREIVKSFKTVV